MTQPAPCGACCPQPCMTGEPTGLPEGLNYDTIELDSGKDSLRGDAGSKDCADGFQDKALNTPRPWDGTQGSFLDVQDPNVLVESWKTAEDGRGTILRLLDLGGRERTVNVQSPLLQLSKVVQTDAVERDQQGLPLVDVHGFKVTVHPYEIVTVRMIGATGADSAASDRTAESSKHTSLEK